MLTKIETAITVEMQGEVKKYQASVKQGDKATRKLLVTLLHNGQPYTIPPGTNVNVNIKKPDGRYVYNSCTFSENIVTVELTNQALAAAGTAVLDIELRTSDNMEILSSASFEIEIERSQRDENAIVSSNESTILDEKEKERNDAETKRAQEELRRVEAETARREAEILRGQQYEVSKTATADATAAAKACEGIVIKQNTMVDTVTKKTGVLGIEDGILVVREL